MATSFLQKNTILKKAFAAAWVAFIAPIILKMSPSPGGPYCYRQRMSEMGNFLLAGNIDVKTVFSKTLIGTLSGNGIESVFISTEKI